jgi:sterol desaturase/sphingolipid hydroxylase (fatty acid hydroxylase superfamily)
VAERSEAHDEVVVSARTVSTSGGIVSTITEPAIPPPPPPYRASSATIPPPPPPYRAPRRTESPSRVPSWLPTVVLVSVLVIGLPTRFGPVIGLLVGLAVLTPLERMFPRHRQPLRRTGLRTDVFHFLFTGLLNTAAIIAGVVVVIVLLSWARIDATASWLAAQPGWIQGAVAFLVFEVFGYWYHRLSHTVSFLWRFHAVHHSSATLDWLSAPRLHPFEGFFGFLVIAPPMYVLGVPAQAIGAFGVVTQLWAIVLHANIRWRMRPLDGIWGTPEYHHWHHSNHPEARNRNFSGLLPVIDMVFGTYYQPKDRRPEIYGIDDPMPTGYLAQLRQPLRRRSATTVATPF